MTDAGSLQEVLASYGPVEARKLSRIEAFGVKAMSRSWTSVPHVTHHDRMDVSRIEAARARLNADGRERRLSPVPFLVKAVAAALRRSPRCNAAYDADNGIIIQRGYVSIGIAVDTPAGLVIGVVRDADGKSVTEIAAEADTLAAKARGKGLSLSEMSGSGFTVSSLGGLGGTGFTPIVNAPEAAILGVSRLEEVPRRGPDDAIEWRPMLPVSLSYDHRVLNGADAGRFLQHLQEELDRLADMDEAH